MFLIAEVPYITQAPASNTTATEGQSVVLTCKASGNHVPKITWYFYEQPLTAHQVTQHPNGDLQMDVSLENIQLI